MFRGPMKTVFIITLLSTPCLAARVSDERIVYDAGGGNVAIVAPADDSGLSIGQVLSRDVPKGARAKVVPVTLIPEDRGRRNEWSFSPNAESGIQVPTSAAGVLR